MKSTLIKNKQLSNLAVYGMGQGINLVTPLLLAPYIISVCGEQSYGKIGVSMALCFFLIVIIDYGADITGVKDVSVNRNDAKELSRIVSTAYASKLILLLLTLAAASVLFIAVPFFSREKELFFLSLTIVAGQFMSPGWIFQGLENFAGVTFFNIISKAVYAAGVLLYIKQPEDYIYAPLWWGTGMMAAGLLTFLYMRAAHKITLVSIKGADIMDFLKSNFSIFGSQVFLSLQLYSPIMLISFFAGDAMAGKYRIVEQVITIFKTYIFLFFNYMYPRVCYLLEANVSQAMLFWKRYNMANMAFLLIAMTILYIEADVVVAYFRPQSINEITSLLRFAVLVPVVYGISIPLKQLVLGTGHQKFYIRLTVISVILNILAIIILLPCFGLYGVLASLVITEIVIAALYSALIYNKGLRLSKKQ